MILSLSETTAFMRIREEKNGKRLQKQLRICRSGKQMSKSRLDIIKSNILVNSKTLAEKVNTSCCSSSIKRSPTMDVPDPQQSALGPHWHRTHASAGVVVGLLHTFKHFSYLGDGSDKVALSRPTHQPSLGGTRYP